MNLPDMKNRTEGKRAIPLPLPPAPKAGRSFPFAGKKERQARPPEGKTAQAEQAPKAPKLMSPRAFFRLMLGCTAGILLLCGTAVAVFDPFYHYHAPLGPLRAVLNEKEYQVVGTLRHFDYDAVLAGSSVVENVNNRDIDNAFGCTGVKAVRSYGGTADLCWFLSEAHRTHEVIQVFYNLDPVSFQGPAETTFASTGCPMYLYDRNPFNDVNYLFNRDVLLKRIPYMLAQSFSPSYEEGKSYYWATDKDFSESAVLEHYLRTPSVQPMQQETLWEEECDANIALLTREIESHPETEYRFFYSPYSMLWWDNAIRTGERDAVLYNEEKVMRALLSYKNVEVYNYQDAEEIVTDLNNYMDTLHFTPQINAWIIGEMAAGRGRVTEATVDVRLEGIRKMSDSLQERYLAAIGKAGRFQYGLAEE
ncbi:MAG: SGNH/GDSL hydrolase family protein [Lachnospiraceae bacterium]|nr:SGNH/GDSL hydrolase family protein [Lachnospiraceae bacterium]